MLTNELRQSILACTTNEQLIDARNQALRHLQDTVPVDDEGDRDETEFTKLDRLTDFVRSSKLDGNPVYTMSERIATWLDKARSADPDGPRPALYCVLVTEFKGQLWAMTADGYRLHGYVCDGIPAGLYYMVDNELAAATDLKPAPLLSVIGEVKIGWPIPDPAIIERPNIPPTASWGMTGNHLAHRTSEQCDYHINSNYWRDAMSLIANDWTYGFAGKLSYLTPLHLFLGDMAIAVIMPMRLEGLPG